MAALPANRIIFWLPVIFRLIPIHDHTLIDRTETRYLQFANLISRGTRGLN
jgi:hypothetical protein